MQKLNEPNGKAAGERQFMAEQLLWKISDVAQYLRLPLNSVYKMTGPKSAIRIPHMRIAGKVRFRKADVDQWLDQFIVSTNGLIAKLPTQIGDCRDSFQNRD
jgi:excisionase family DNA binding protein